MDAIELSQRQSNRVAELPEDYRVVGVDRRAPLVRKPTGQILRMQQNGRLIAATTPSQAQARRPPSRSGEAPRRERFAQSRTFRR
jgi:hypothetical protein